MTLPPSFASASSTNSYGGALRQDFASVVEGPHNPRIDERWRRLVDHFAESLGVRLLWTRG